MARALRSTSALAAVGAAMAAAALLGSPAGAVGTRPLDAAPAPGVGVHVCNGGRLGPAHTTASRENFSSAVVGPLERWPGHPDNTPYIAAGYVDGSVHVWDALNCRQKFVVHTGPGAIQASLAMVQIKGRTYILGANEAGDVFMYTGGGRLFFRVRMAARYAGGLRGGFATPTIAYLDGNSVPFVVESGWDMKLWAWSVRTGRVAGGFPVFLRDTSWSSPAVAYLYGGRFPDIVVGYDCGGSPAQRCYPKQGGYIGVFNHRGRMVPGWPHLLVGETIWSSPAVVKLHPAGAPDIVVGTGLFPYPRHPGAGQEVLALTSHGRMLPHWPVHVSGKVFSSPAVGRVWPGDYTDVAVTAQGGYTYLISPNGRIDWKGCAGTIGHGCASAHSSPVIADVLGQGRPQVITGAANNWQIYGASGTRLMHGNIPQTAAGLSAAPTVTSIGGHAAIFFTLAAKQGPNRRNAEVVWYRMPSPLGPHPWPMFKQNACRTGTTRLAC